MSNYLKRIEEKHFNAGPARPVRHCEPKMPCDVVKLARALDFIDKALEMDALVQARRKAERTLKKIADE